MEIIFILRCLAIANAGESVFMAFTFLAPSLFAAKEQSPWDFGDWMDFNGYNFKKFGRILHFYRIYNSFREKASVSPTYFEAKRLINYSFTSPASIKYLKIATNHESTTTPSNSLYCQCSA